MKPGPNEARLRTRLIVTAIGVAVLLSPAGCTRVDREAMSFPDMPSMPIYHRADDRQLPPDQSIDALQSAESACRTLTSDGAASSPAVGTPAFDSCMQNRGYRRVR